MFNIDLTTGLLAPMTPATVPTGRFPQFIAVDPKGRFLYTANTLDDSVSIYRINSSGILIPANPSSIPAAKHSGSGPNGVTIDPSGRFAYTSNQSGSVSEFSIDQLSGTLNPIGTGEVTGVVTPFPPTIDPAGYFLYVPDSSYNRLYVFLIDQMSGALTPSSQSFIAVEQGPTSVAVDPKSKYVYVVNRLANTISQFNIRTNDGMLVPMSVPTVANPGSPYQILMDPAGELVYVSNEDLNTVTIYSIGVGGALTPYSIAATGGNPAGIGVARKR